MRASALDNGGQGWSKTVMANQSHNCGEPPKLDNGPLPSREPVGEPNSASSDGADRFDSGVHNRTSVRPRGASTECVRVIPKRKPRPVVYFAQASNGLIKIGNTKYITDRISILRGQSPLPIELVASVKGERRLEFDYHARFAAHRLHGEWFTPHPDILAEIDRLNSRPATGRQSSAGLSMNESDLRDAC